MILANLTRAIREQNWFAVTVEFLIVIAGVVIGFQVSVWSAERTEREAMAGYVARLQEELGANLVQMDNQELLAEWVRGHTIDALEALQGDRDALGVNFIIDAYIAGHTVGALIPSDTFDELISTGALRTIPDAEVRQVLIRFYRIADFAETNINDQSGYQAALRRSMPHDIINLIRQNCSAVFGLDQQGSARFSVPDTCPPDLSDEAIADAIANLTAVDLVPDLRESLSLIEVKFANISRVRDAATDALAALEQLE